MTDIEIGKVYTGKVKKIMEVSVFDLSINNSVKQSYSNSSK